MNKNNEIFIKRKITNILFHSCILRIYKTIFPNKNPIILMYHKVEEDNFDKQMRYLKNNYNVVSLQELVNTIKKRERFEKNIVVITFDDGYLNNYIYAYPVLKRYCLPATFFVLAGNIGTGKFSWWDSLDYAISKHRAKKYTFKFNNVMIHLDLNNDKKKSEATNVLHRLLSTYNHKMREMALKKLYTDLGIKPEKKNIKQYLFMNWEQLSKLNKSNFEIGAHTVTHPFLSNILINEAKKEIIDSKKKIEKKLKNSVFSFCYPSGDMSSEIEKLVKEANYSCACSIKRGDVSLESDIFALKRVGINIRDNLPIFALKVSRLRNLIKSKVNQNEN